MDRTTIDTYNRMAQEYDQETADFWEQFPRSFLDAFARQARGRVLDVGSGPGRDAQLLNERGLEVVCLDASEAMVALTSRQGFDSMQGDFTAMPFEDETFDAVWAYTSLLHIPKTEADSAIKEVRRVLKPDGVFALGMIEGGAEEYRETSGMAKPRWFSFYSKKELKTLLARHDFQILHFEEFKPGSRNYLNFISRKR